MILRRFLVAVVALCALYCTAGDDSSSLRVSVRSGTVVGTSDTVFFDVAVGRKTCRPAKLVAAIESGSQADEVSLQSVFDRVPGKGLTATASVAALALLGAEPGEKEVVVQLYCRNRLSSSSSKIAFRYRFEPDDIFLHIFGFDRIEVDDGAPVYVFAPSTELGVSARITPHVAAKLSIEPPGPHGLAARLAHSDPTGRRWSIVLPPASPRPFKIAVSIRGRKVAAWTVRIAPPWRSHVAGFSERLDGLKTVTEGRKALLSDLKPIGWRRHAALLALSRLARSTGATAAARALFEDMLTNATALRSPSEQAASHRRLAFINTVIGGYDAARRHLDHSARITERWRDIVGQGFTWRALGALLLRTQPPGAVALASESFQRCRRSAQRRGDARLASLCAVYEAATLAQHESVSRARQLLAAVPPDQQQSDIWKAMRVFVEYHALELGSLNPREVDALGALTDRALSTLTPSAEPSLPRFLMSAQVRIGLEQGNLARAQGALAQLGRLRADSAILDSIPLPLLRAEVAIAAGRFAAAAASLNPILGSATTLTEDRLHALLLLAEAQESTGKFAAAEQTLSRLDRDLVALFQRFSLPPSRARLLRRLRRGLEFQQRIRLQRGQVLRALAVGEQLRLLTLSAFVPTSAPEIISRLDELDALPGRLPTDTGILVVEPYSQGLLAYFTRSGGSWRHSSVKHVQEAVSLLGGGLRALYLTGHALAGVDVADLRDEDGRSLAIGLEILRLPSLLPSAAPHTRKELLDKLIIGDPDGTLLHGAEESEVVANLVRGTTVLVGPAATRGRALAALGAGVDLFHFSGHAEHSVGDPLSIRLRLYDGVLRLQDWLRIPTTPRLVVLNTCSSGPPAGPYTVGLSEILLALGSRYVMTTSRRVKDEGSRKFMQLFYQFGGQNNPPRALRRAAEAADIQGIDTWRAVQLWSNTLESYSTRSPR